MDPLGTTQLQELFETRRDALYRFFRHLTGNAADADDLLQETFLTVWRKRAQFTGRGSLMGYLRSTGFRLFLNSRTRSARRAALAPPMTPEPHAEPADRALEREDGTRFLVERVRAELSELPEESRDAFVLFRFEGLPCAEIAELTGAPLKTVESRVRRATRQLAQRLEPYREHLPQR